MTKTILVTGGTSYIGSHTVKALLNAGYKVQSSIISPQEIERLWVVVLALKNWMFMMLAP